MSEERAAAKSLDPMSVPDARGRFGEYGGRYVPETLTRPWRNWPRNMRRRVATNTSRTELQGLLRDYVGRPSPLYYARRLSEQAGGAQIWLKREDLNHTGSHKINNTLGQALLTIRMGKQRVIAETGAGQHGVATATACARFGLPCVVYMGEEDIRRQAPNVLQHAVAGSRSAAGRDRFAHAARRDQRGHARLDVKR